MRLGDGEKTIAYVETKPSALDTSRLREKSSGKKKKRLYRDNHAQLKI